MHGINRIPLIKRTTATECLTQARELVNQLESGNMQQADIIMSQLCSIRENDLYMEIGKLTRDLHETINEFTGDTRLKTITNKEMTTARHDLKHVIGLTEEAANQTLTAIEHSMPLLGTLSKRAIRLRELLNTHISESTNNNGFEFIATELDAYFDKVVDDLKSVNEDMNTALMAQAYQDITGQIIQRVSTMVQDVEHSLVGILQVNSHHMNQYELKEVVKNNAGYGPSVPGDSNSDSLQSQDDVDELLSTLGF
jgi:chemotaxis protein CheZ